MRTCLVRRAAGNPEGTGAWDGPVWSAADTLALDCFVAAKPAYKPRAQARVLYDDRQFFVLFRVEDRYVRSVHTRPNDPVSEDSCVEFFARPNPLGGYFNFEINAGGTMLLYYIEDWKRTAAGFQRFRRVDAGLMKSVRIFHSLPRVVDPEITNPVTWTIECAIPLRLIETYVGQLGVLSGTAWRANFYTCGDRTSHPRWASWSPIGRGRNFHQPGRFGELRFE